jgi:thiol-disulfide isomerase/thioredoxin
VKSARISLIKTSLAVMAGLLLNATVHAENRQKPSLDFELSNGREFVRLSDLPPQLTVINFWRYDCPPCVREMPLLANLAHEGKVRVITIALHRPSEAILAPLAAQQALAAPILSLFGPSEPRGLLSRFGNRHGAIPHTVLLNPRRQVCAQLTGEISATWVKSALTHCPT